MVGARPGPVALACGLLVATLGAIVRRRDRAAWAGAALFGWGYALIALGGPFLADQYNDSAAFDIWDLDGAVRPLADRFHPGLSEPADPFPNNRITLDPATGIRTMNVSNQEIPLTPDQSKRQVDFEARNASHLARLRDGRHARAIGLAIQGLAFAMAGAVVGHALEGPSPPAGEPMGAPTPDQPD